MRAAKLVGAKVTPMTPDSEDVQALVKSTAKAPVLVADAGEGVRWAESGWWLVPVLVALSLFSFRRVDKSIDREPSQ